MIRGFFLCGIIGWIMEVVWTGIWSLINGNLKMVSTTSLIMFPIYGMAVLLKPLYDVMIDMPILMRGGIYVIFIFTAEYFFGVILTKMGVCPWNYSEAKFNINGLIRLDYAPAWFAAGLIFETLVYTKIHL